MIKSKIDARERALELAVEFCKGQTGSDELVVRCAEGFKSFLIGDAELPETQSDTELVKAFLDVLNNELEKTRRQDNIDFAKMLEEVRAKNAGLNGTVDTANMDRSNP